MREKPQCEHIRDNGKRCLRRIFFGEKYCKQHRPWVPIGGKSNG